jgi:hypothetical protein
MLVAEVAEQGDREGEQPLAPLPLRRADLLRQQFERAFVFVLLERRDYVGQLAGFLQLGDEPLGRGGAGQCVEELSDRRRRQGADELAHDLAVAERLHGRDALDRVAERQLLVCVDVDLDERELAGSGLSLALEHGTEHAAGAAPGGPEVDHDRQLVGALEHVALEAFGCHVHQFHCSFSVRQRRAAAGVEVQQLVERAEADRARGEDDRRQREQHDPGDRAGADDEGDDDRRWCDEERAEGAVAVVHVPGHLGLLAAVWARVLYNSTTNSFIPQGVSRWCFRIPSPMTWSS